MATGMEMMIKALGIDPAQIIETAKGIGETVVALKQQMDRIEKNQHAIMYAMGIPPVGQIALQEHENGEAQEHGG